MQVSKLMLGLIQRHGELKKKEEVSRRMDILSQSFLLRNLPIFSPEFNEMSRQQYINTLQSII